MSIGHNPMQGVNNTMADTVIPIKILTREKMTFTKMESLKNLTVKATVPI
jgi:hypothetical protein